LLALQGERYQGLRSSGFSIKPQFIVKEGFSWVRGALPRWVTRFFSVPPGGQDGISRKAVVMLLLSAVVAAGGVVAWRYFAVSAPVVAFSEVATALEAGVVEQVRVEKSGTRLTATLRSDGGAGESVIMAVLPAGALELSDLERWSAAGAEVRVARTYTSQGQLVSLFGLILIGGVLIYMTRVHRGVSKRFDITPVNRQLTLADVGGAKEATDELRDVIQYLKDPTRFTVMGAACPTGVLLVGPPGTGKTLLARAVAGESGVPVIVASGSEFAEMYVGVGARRIRDLAKQARKLAPCIVFIDEFDSVGGKRGRPNRTGEEETTLNQLLVEMDGMAGSAGVVWMAATNREDMLDPAVRRPGRFDRVVEVGLPGAADRHEILRVHVARRPMAPDVQLERLAAMTVGYSGADLANLLNEAAIIAVQEDCTQIHQRHIEQARDKIMLGRVRAGVVIGANELRLIALHEAGHALVGILACPEDRLHKVTIEARGRSLGAAHFAPDTDRHLYSRRYLEGVIAKALGGRAAELVFLGPDAVTSGAGSDLVHATGIARRMVGEFGMSPEVGLVSADPSAQGGAPSGHLQAEIDKAVRSLIETQAKRAEELVRQHRAAVEALADRLVTDTVLIADEVHEILARHGISAELAVEDSSNPPHVEVPQPA
jgi:cell division protease FtsH